MNVLYCNEHLMNFLKIAQRRKSLVVMARLKKKSQSTFNLRVGVISGEGGRGGRGVGMWGAAGRMMVWMGIPPGAKHCNVYDFCNPKN